MRVVVFFMCLVFILSGGSNTTVYAASGHINSYASTNQEIKNSLQLQIITAERINDTLKDASIADEEVLDIIDNEDEDDRNKCFARKNMLPCNSNSIFPYQSIAGYHRNSFKAAPSFCGQLSHIYIVQRSLRI